MGTFSKALSVVGGFISADKALIDYPRYYNHPYVFSSALPPSTVAGGSAVRIRVAVSAGHTRADLDEALNHIQDLVIAPLHHVDILRTED